VSPLQGEPMPDSEFRIGHGYDIHRLQTGGRLVLGGVVVAEGISPIAHSDGDVVIHAIVDALLGAAGLGDLGQSFPDTDPAFKGVDSTLFLTSVMAALEQKQIVVVNCDVTIVAERPKLKPFKSQMTELLSKALNAPVNIKAGTNEGCGEIGRGEAVAAHAVVLIERDRSI
jgi:2-C-methyl-D-erythritol 2,4-cyclodiphosphate synthase